MTKREYKDRQGTSTSKEYAKNWVRGYRDRLRLLAIKGLIKEFHKRTMAILKNIK